MTARVRVAPIRARTYCSPGGDIARAVAVGEDESARLMAGEVSYGEHTDLLALRAFGAGLDVLTFDHEHVPGEHLRSLQMDGVTVRPSPQIVL